ncbi:MAG: SCO family protein [Deltaproteobacteria bacterium]|nr:MAG: SCO family protein [Deltaproteobacteria bacterium]
MTAHGAPSGMAAASEARPFYKNPWLWAALFGMAVLTVLKTCSGQQLVPLPRSEAPVPAFTLVSEAGEPFGSAELKGHVWVASFIFTTCTTACPPISEANADLQRLLDAAGPELAGTRLVTFTVDPEMDRPEVLAAYAKRYGAEPARWTFLTSADGTVEPLQQLVRGGFDLAMGTRRADDAGAVDITHSKKLVLVDTEGYIRNYFDADANQRPLIVAYARELTAEAAKKAREGGAQ